MKHTIHVTKEHIDQGQPNVASRCPVALAIKEQLNDVVTVCPMWEFDGTWVFGLGNRDDMPLPEPAARLARDFDRRKPVEPMSFELEVP